MCPIRYSLYHSNRADSERYMLGNPGEPMLFAVGLNPSTATREKSDTTVTKAERIAQLNGYNGFVMLNLYPLRATMPGDLPERPVGRTINRNLRAIREVMIDYPEPVCWACWGNEIERRPWLRDCAQRIIDQVALHRGHWIHYGPLTQKGHPRHPSRTGYRYRFAAWAGFAGDYAPIPADKIK